MKDMAGCVISMVEDRLEHSYVSSVSENFPNLLLSSQS